MPQKSRGATLLAPNTIEIREYSIPEIPPDAGLVAVEIAGVCGPDVKYYHGRIRLPLPIILGHEILGRVVKLGREAASIHGLKEGDRIILKGALGCGRCADCRRGTPCRGSPDFRLRDWARRQSPGPREALRRPPDHQCRGRKCS